MKADVNSSHVYIGIGSNLDDPLKHVTRAIAELEHLPKSRMLASSRLYRSKPMGPANQPDYINAVVKLATELSPHALLDELQLDAYIFEVEPRDETWALTIECACETDGGWETIKLQVPKQMLLGSFEDERAKHHLFEYWKKELVGCKLRQP